ncbi:MAG: hypothetical protein RI897_4314 [Verrucomicrobiota bacterium]
MNRDLRSLITVIFNLRYPGSGHLQSPTEAFDTDSNPDPDFASSEAPNAEWAPRGSLGE